MAGPGRVIRDRYELRSQLGRGGMGTVWLAKDRMLGRLVALKEIALTPYGEGLAVQRVRAMREARSLARIRHPAIAEIYDVFEEGGSPWIVMVYVEGGSLDDLIGRRTLSEREIAALGRDVLAGLTAAHAAHVLHRDVKPANIVVGRDGKVVLVDFGIAQIVGESGLTSHSILLGTSEFMAPERIEGRAVGPAADLWSLGVTFFCALEGYSPFRRDNAYATVHAVCNDDLPQPRRRGPLYDVIAGLLRKDPAHRMGAAELDRRLAAIAATPPPERKRPERPVERPRSRSPQPPPVPHTASLRSAAAALAAMAPGAAGQALDAMAGDPSRAAGVLALLPSGQAGRWSVT
ncbi:hypothetical protein B1L11_07555 [Microbispora sp. GKU 823]|nr:hypothetical protein B1L11_07555 [Microbispora sp. GKU 823]